MQRDPEVPPQVGQDREDEVRAQRQPTPDGRVDAGPDGGEEEDEDLRIELLRQLFRGKSIGEIERGQRNARTHDKVDRTRRRRRLPGQLVKRCEVILAIPKRPGQDHPPCSTPCAGRICDRGSVVGRFQVVVDQGGSGLVRSGRDEFDGLGGDVLVRGEKVSRFGIDDGYAAHGYEREIEIETTKHIQNKIINIS